MLSSSLEGEIDDVFFDGYNT